MCLFAFGVVANSLILNADDQELAAVRRQKRTGRVLYAVLCRERARRWDREKRIRYQAQDRVRPTDQNPSS